MHLSAFFLHRPPKRKTSQSAARLIDVPLCRGGELREEEGTGAEMDGKVGGEINWSHYAAVCYLLLEELQRFRAWTADEARICAL